MLSRKTISLSHLKNSVLLGDSEELLKKLPRESINLIFTSPPYLNCRPYSQYPDYQAYLDTMQRIIHECHEVLAEGRFLIINISPVLVQRTSRSSSSTRLALPFDLHGRIAKEGFDFIDDIIWEKPEGAGWALGRGRRFSADRNPLQYKPVTVTEYVLVYRKHTSKLIDWNIRKHPDQQAIQNSKIQDGYEKTNIWKIVPAHSKDHPAVFPRELADRVISYYSFENDVVLDPFAGTGTTGIAAKALNRRYVLIENNSQYFDLIMQKLPESATQIEG
jgi:DNA modification methylase